MTDNEILDLIAKHDDSALAELERSYSAACLEAANAVTDNEAVSRECFFDALISFWNNRGSAESASETSAESYAEVDQIGDFLINSTVVNAKKRTNNTNPSFMPAGSPPIFEPLDPDFEKVDMGTGTISEAAPVEVDTGTGTVFAGTDSAISEATPDEVGRGTGTVSGKVGKGTGTRTAGKRLIMVAVVAAAIAIIVTAVVLIAGRGMGGRKQEPGNLAAPGATAMPVGDTLKIKQLNAKMPYMIDRFVSSDGKVLTRSDLAEKLGQGDMGLIFSEAQEAIRQAGQDLCGSELLLVKNENEQDKTTETWFMIEKEAEINANFLTFMEKYIPTYDGIEIMWEVPLTIKVGYIGKAVMPDKNAEKLYICNVERVEPIAFLTISEFTSLNPFAVDAVLQKKLTSENLDDLNEFIKSCFSETAATGVKGWTPLKTNLTSASFGRGKTGDELEIRSARTIDRMGNERVYTYSYDSAGLLESVVIDSALLISKATVADGPGYYEPDGYWSSAGSDGSVGSAGSVGSEGGNYEDGVYIISGSANSSIVYTFSGGQLKSINLLEWIRENGSKTLKSVALVRYISSTGVNGEDVGIRFAETDMLRIYHVYDENAEILRKEVWDYQGKDNIITEYTGMYPLTENKAFSPQTWRYWKQSCLRDGSIRENVYNITDGNTDAAVRVYSAAYDANSNESSFIFYDAGGTEIVRFDAFFGSVIPADEDYLPQNATLFFGDWYLLPRTDEEKEKLFFAKTPDDYGGVVSIRFKDDANSALAYRPEMLTVNEDGRFSLYMNRPVFLPVTTDSPADFEVYVQVRLTGRAVRSNGSGWPVSSSAEPVPVSWNLYPDELEYVGLSATTELELFEFYSVLEPDMFTDKYGRRFAGIDDADEFCDKIRVYLAQASGAGRMVPDDGAWLAVYMMESNGAVDQIGVIGLNY
ncbi:MAG: hypothetical protein J5950_00630 [Clostridia bacterium]|nr:hypothetical protein [Clostridia bacterium]